MLDTRVCAMLGIRYPIVQAGMAVHTSAELVAAVSNAGGLGLHGTVYRDLETVIDQVEQTRGLTDRPFGANVVLAEPHDALLDYLIDGARLPVISTSWGDPASVCERAHAAGLLVMHQAETADEAARVVAAGVDVIVAQGSDGGGHIGKVGTLALVPAIVDVAGDVPVIAAGGIADGRGLAAALALGAEGALIGTRFLATTESPVSGGWKQAILSASAEEAWQTDLPDLVGDNHWPGASTRVLANRLVREWIGRESAIPAERAAIRSRIDADRERGDVAGLFLYAGQSAGLIHDIIPAGELVERIANEATAALRRIA